MEAIFAELKENKDLSIGEHELTIENLCLNWQPKTSTFYFNGSQLNVVTMSLLKHEKRVIECSSVELDEFQKSDFPQLVVQFDCEKLINILLLRIHICIHVTPHVNLINSMQF